MTVPAATEDHFDDDNGTAHESSLNRLAEAGIIEVPADRQSRFDQSITRAEMADWTAGALTFSGVSLDGSTDWYPDDDGHIHEAAINKITDAGIVTGQADGTFGPDLNLTRAQMATFMARTVDALFA